MKRPMNLILAVLLLVAGTLGTLQGRHIDSIREGQVFYEWIIAAGTHVRLFDDEKVRTKRTVEYANDVAFLKEVEKAATGLLPDVPREERVMDDGRTVGTLAYLTASDENYDLLFKLARNGALDGVRKDFLARARDQKLKLAQYEGYVSGANIFNLFFGFRQLAANFIWLEVDRLWHEGTVHLMVPLMESCVLLDPHFIDAYLLGAWHVAYNVTAKLDDTPENLKVWSDEYGTCVGEKESFYYWAAEFLQSGIEHNPRNYKLPFDLGFAIYKNKLNDYPNAVAALKTAVSVPHEVWVPRQLYIVEELNGQFEEARAGWIDYMKRYPNSATGSSVAPRFVRRNEGRIAEKRMLEVLQALDKATDPDERAKLQAEADKYRAEALKIWESMGDEPYAVGRRLRMKAQDLIRENKIRDAIGVLEKARWESNDFWDEGSEMIIRLKQKHGLNLSLSEKMWILRQEGGTDCRGMPPELRGRNKRRN